MIRSTHLLGLVLALSAGSVLAQNIAVVNGRPIPKEKADLFMSELEKQGQARSPELATVVRQELVDREILMQEAERRGLPAMPATKFQIESARQQILIQALVHDELSKRPLTEDIVRKEYERLTSANVREYRARHILLETEQEAKDVIAKLQKGTAFEALARQSKDPGSAAQGGDLDWATPQSFVKPFSDAMVALQKGQFTSQPVQSQFGWHVIRLDDTRESKPPAFEDVRDQLTETLQRRRLSEFQQSLKAKAKIK
jgi:peptidyl-prolyl cis-trans isomerase C